MDQELVARLQRFVAERLEADHAGGRLVTGRRVELAPGELEPEQRVVELRGGPPEGGRDLLHDLLLQRGVRLLDVEPLAEPVEIRALVAAVLQLGDERLPRRLPHHVPTSTPFTAS